MTGAFAAARWRHRLRPVTTAVGPSRGPYTTSKYGWWTIEKAGAPQGASGVSRRQLPGSGERGWRSLPLRWRSSGTAVGSRRVNRWDFVPSASTRFVPAAGASAVPRLDKLAARRSQGTGDAHEQSVTR